MKVVRCLECGHVTFELWKGLDRCPECSGDIEHIEEDMGPRERIPRVLKMGGILLVMVVLVLIVFNSFSGSVPESLLRTAFVILLVAILFLGMSLAYVYVLSREACAKVQGKDPPARRGRGSALHRGPGSGKGGRRDEVVTGGMPRSRGTKILPGRK